MTNHIIINSIIPRIRYVSNGVLSTYTFPFAIFKNADLKVYFNSTLQESTTYSVSGSGESSGGSVTLTNVPDNGVIITLTRELSIERTTDFQEGGVLRANTLNHELDYQIACQQQIADNLNRSMVLPPYAADTNVNLTLPTPSAGKAIIWNNDGTNLENSTVEVNALESTLKGYKTAAETAANTATDKADLASNKANIATEQAQVATEKAQIATEKAQEVSEALSQKVNTNFDNITATAKSIISNLCLPDYSAGIAIGSNTYTALQDGWLLVDTGSTNAVAGIWFGSTELVVGGGGTVSHNHRYLIPILSGQTLTSTKSNGIITFFPMKGVNNV